jgi:hypothetical protein
MGIDLKSTDTRPIKATKLALDVIRANEIAIENSNSKLLIKPNKWLNSKKKRSKMI